MLDGHLQQAVALARRVHRLAPTACILFLADSAQRSAIRQRLGLAPMLGSDWYFVDVEAGELERALAGAQRAAGQRRQVRSTVQRIGTTLGKQRRAFDSVLRRELLTDHHLASVLTHGFDAVVCLGEDLEVLSWNQAAEELLGVPEERVVGQTADALARQGLFPGDLLPLMIRIREQHGRQRLELRVRRPNGEHRELDASVAPVREELGRVVGAALIARDITERKRQEARVRLARDDAQRANAARTAFWPSCRMSCGLR